MKIGDIIERLERIAPTWMGEDGDSVGLQVGDINQDVTSICVAVDPSLSVIDKTATQGAQMLVTHHPLIRTPLKVLAVGDPVADRVLEVVRRNIALYVIHTNYDTVSGGISDILAEKLGLVNIGPLSQKRSDTLYKIVVFVPEEAVCDVRDAMSQAGAGRIGQYSCCSFRTKGIGSFRAEVGAKPYVGSIGEIEQVNEWRLEMVCTRSVLNDVLVAMYEKHPYEEVAYDVYELSNPPARFGLGRVGILPTETSLGKYAEFVGRELCVRHLRVFGDSERLIMRVAVCGGSGGSLYREAVEVGADVYVTADWRYHDIQNALDMGLAVIDAGHFETEKPGVVALAERLTRELGSEVAVEYVE
ncbi:MAG: Nif3-like dinuclear metal center hexameric protein [Armatimonadota bacterium]